MFLRNLLKNTFCDVGFPENILLSVNQSIKRIEYSSVNVKVRATCLACKHIDKDQGLVVPSWISANPGLKLTPRCFSLCISACVRLFQNF